MGTTLRVCLKCGKSRAAWAYGTSHLTTKARLFSTENKEAVGKDSLVLKSFLEFWSWSLVYFKRLKMLATPEKRVTLTGSKYQTGSIFTIILFWLWLKSGLFTLGTVDSLGWRLLCFPVRCRWLTVFLVPGTPPPLWSSVMSPDIARCPLESKNCPWLSPVGLGSLSLSPFFVDFRCNKHQLAWLDSKSMTVQQRTYRRSIKEMSMPRLI